ncbi:Rhodanese-like domain-containing protein [Immersiella caudata]|uniref:Rhodanese-like domain-containing protein n=1 Tax=Immersiella caudata TaxID=314043 RepID=A0AA39WJM1_9PEZI|nr:Rhodanese-like domain-containing protein [Immersiella caudata]
MQLPRTLSKFQPRSLNHLCRATMSTTTRVPPTEASPPPWHAAYPAPRTSQPNGMTREEVLAMLNSQLKDNSPSCQRDFVLVDLRRNDHEGGTIRGSINLPAQSLYPTIPTLYSLFKVANVRRVLWYCGSSGGRGTRAAGWFADHIEEQGDKEMQSLVLVGGIKGWARAGSECTEWMDGYDVSVWSKLDS